MEDINEIDRAAAVSVIKEKVEELMLQTGYEMPIFVLIAGGSCSGKTYLANELCRAFGDDMASLMSLDDYYRDHRDEKMPRDSEGRLNFDHPDAYRVEEILKAVQLLYNWYPAWTPKYDMASNTFLGRFGQKILSHNVIVIEGLFAIDFIPAAHNQLKVYLDIDYDLALKRRLERDMRKYFFEEAKAEKIFSNRVWPNQELYISGQKEKADIVIRPDV